MIQYISFTQYNNFNSGEIECTSISKPRSLDEFDYVFIDLSSSDFWNNKANDFMSINKINDIINLSKMIQLCKIAKIIVIIPQDLSFNYNYSNMKYTNSLELKNNLKGLEKIIFKNLSNIFISEYSVLVFENTKTEVQGVQIEADFIFNQNILNGNKALKYNILTKSHLSKKITSVEINNLIFTTLNISMSETHIYNFLEQIGLLETKEKRPDWFKAINKFDDSALSKRKEEINKAIKFLEDEMSEINKKIESNNEIKSILYTNSNELAIQVYSILEKILECDLSEFKDEHKEDFQIEREEIIFIGEIKGVTSNVRNENVSQLENHVQSYNDSIDEAPDKKFVKGLLIINHLRNVSPIERKNVDEKQIKLAERYGSLIITTIDLLDLYEKYLNSEVTTTKILEIFSAKTGLYNNDYL